MSYRDSRCRECGAPIVWFRNERGTWVPTEREPFDPARVPAREKFLVHRGRLEPAPAAKEPVTVAHFACCPARLGDRLAMLRHLWPALAARAERHQLIRGAGRKSA